ncbi:TPA: hypothetical protein PJI95_004653 [Salmonella enterica subsp. enterica serovar Enteritidis]|uniref:Uncharacterized protein n=1 Tax=Salmonella enteritidis TaxID=149539 RepID=A0A704G220_SALEN|nr:hypothetical protein [Salmonella enterica subsp. enterica serovar Enteritidis]HAR8860293.1 hypothetical protein [Salmonella enterica]HAC8161990.1 hypothetical protein [Salmonella enterica subsp. enterica serovar Enteritidis]HDG6815303.1 hypothetical protein [Salmonella enterica subsp. enterica serovar Enteritidis]HDH0060633.1 hypothetical protein [Salmonella enterica subsp. enterica serovar Enteritidis]
MKQETKNKLIKGLRISAIPLVGTLKLLYIPFVAPYTLGKKILDVVIHAGGRPGHEVNSFDVWYKIKKLNEDTLAFNIRRTAFLSLMCFVLSILGLALTYLAYINNVPPLLISSSIVFSLVSFAQYFHFTVFCHCFKTRSFDNKLDAFKSLESIFPNPFWENVEVKNSDGKKVHAEFYPKGKKILKK